jgi:plastocyanin
MITLTLIAASVLGGFSNPLNSDPLNHDELGSISGKITWEGDAPAARPDIKIDEKASVGCVHDAMSYKDETLLIDSKGGIANVVLMIEADGVERKVPSEPIVLDQRGCHFEPHVIVVPMGATLRFSNSDETNHNIHTYAKKNQSVNKNVAAAGSMEQKLDKAEVIDIKCDIHPWMKGYVVVTDATHFATTTADGSFKIAGLPPGDYTISYWHEELGKGKTASVTVEGGKDTSLVHKLSAKKKSRKGRRR